MNHARELLSLSKVSWDSGVCSCLGRSEGSLGTLPVTSQSGGVCGTEPLTFWVLSSNSAMPLISYVIFTSSPISERQYSYLCNGDHSSKYVIGLF